VPWVSSQTQLVFGFTERKPTLVKPCKQRRPFHDSL
jgi:hypothetical protein